MVALVLYFLLAAWVLSHVIRGIRDYRMLRDVPHCPTVTDVPFTSLFDADHVADHVADPVDEGAVGAQGPDEATPRPVDPSEEPAYQFPGVPTGWTLDRYARDGLQQIHLMLVQEARRRSTDNPS